MGHLLNKLKCW